MSQFWFRMMEMGGWNNLPAGPGGPPAEGPAPPPEPRSSAIRAARIACNSSFSIFVICDEREGCSLNTYTQKDEVGFSCKESANRCALNSEIREFCSPPSPHNHAHSHQACTHAYQNAAGHFLFCQRSCCKDRQIA